MAFHDENLAERVRHALARKNGIEEKKMFGGICFLLNGNMLVGVWEDSLIVRLGEDQGEDALLEPHVKPFDITGKPMKNWVLVKPEGIKEGVDQLKGWIQRAVKFVGKMAAKWKLPHRKSYCAFAQYDSGKPFSEKIALFRTNNRRRGK